jgi:hypothetical protein
LSKYEQAFQPFQSLPFDKLPSTGSGQAGRTDWKGALRRASFAWLRTTQGEWMKKNLSQQIQTLEAVSKIKNALRALFLYFSLFFFIGWQWR